VYSCQGRFKDVWQTSGRCLRVSSLPSCLQISGMSAMSMPMRRANRRKTPAGSRSRTVPSRTRPGSSKGANICNTVISQVSGRVLVDICVLRTILRASCRTDVWRSLNHGVFISSVVYPLPSTGKNPSKTRASRSLQKTCQNTDVWQVSSRYLQTEESRFPLVKYTGRHF